MKKIQVIINIYYLYVYMCILPSFASSPVTVYAIRVPRVIYKETGCFPKHNSSIVYNINCLDFLC